MRVLFLIYGGGVLVVWAVVSIWKGDLKDVPTTVAVILGAMFGSKALQSLGENSSKKDTSDTSGQQANAEATQALTSATESLRSATVDLTEAMARR